jgi:hypothetical protein
MTAFLLLQYVQPNLAVLLLSVDFFTQCIMQTSESRYNKQSALNEGDNKEANLTQESNSNEILDEKKH